MLIPGMLHFLIFKYVPMAGIIVAFQNYQPFLGLWHSEWVGVEHFQRFFSDPVFWRLMRNTLTLAILSIVFYFPVPIILALMLNEVRHMVFKRVTQTFLYLPHFLSWVVIAGITVTLLNTDGGVVNGLIVQLGGTPIQFLLAPEWFRPLILIQLIWKEAGWGTIIFLAAMAGVDPQLYQSAVVDGAGRFRQIWHITLPSIRTAIITLFIIRLGSFLDTGFEQILLMLNPINRSVGEVFDTYVYQTGIIGGQFSYTTAVGLFKSAVALLLVVVTNYLVKKSGEEGVF
nr:ABC transporter permease subunit [Paenibacillus koleovorans]